MSFFAYLFQDRRANQGNIKGQLILFASGMVQVSTVYGGKSHLFLYLFGTA